MTESRPAASTTSPEFSRRHFIRHFAEMVVAMIVGMMVLDPVWKISFAGLGWSALLDRPDLYALVMAIDMTVGMSLWMRYRRHSWTSVWEMAAAMLIPFIVLVGPFWAGILSGEALLAAGHILMLPLMIVAMLHRRAEYGHDHRQHTASRLCPSGSATKAP